MPGFARKHVVVDGRETNAAWLFPQVTRGKGSPRGEINVGCVVSIRVPKWVQTCIVLLKPAVRFGRGVVKIAKQTRCESGGRNCLWPAAFGQEFIGGRIESDGYDLRRYYVPEKRNRVERNGGAKDVRVFPSGNIETGTPQLSAGEFENRRQDLPFGPTEIEGAFRPWWVRSLPFAQPAQAGR